MTGDEFRAAAASVGLVKQTGPDSIETFFGVGERTARRWIADGPPDAVAMLLRLMIARRIKPAAVRKIFEAV